ncbi:LxmA leader domain family RiPP [Streptomyces sp. NPDC001401]|uniref:LxmA leader domain family RiPP n=1 Tax=Streptomyces sp. NPDC001401 TaxID=3364570 RepID=UPI00369C4AC1
MTESLISGYIAYTTADRLGASAMGEAPATSPLTVTTVSSPECSAMAASALESAISAATGHFSC